MLDAQLHYPIFTYEYRAHATHGAAVAKRGLRRIYRLGEGRSTRRETRGR